MPPLSLLFLELGVITQNVLKETGRLECGNKGVKRTDQTKDSIAVVVLQGFYACEFQTKCLLLPIWLFEQFH